MTKARVDSKPQAEDIRLYLARMRDLWIGSGRQNQSASADYDVALKELIAGNSIPSREILRRDEKIWRDYSMRVPIDGGREQALAKAEILKEWYEFLEIFERARRDRR